jgi:hypothetical protein
MVSGVFLLCRIFGMYKLTLQFDFDNLETLRTFAPPSKVLPLPPLIIRIHAYLPYYCTSLMYVCCCVQSVPDHWWLHNALRPEQPGVGLLYLKRKLSI